MKITQVPDAQSAAEVAADEIVTALTGSQPPVLGCAAGRTPVLTYRALAHRRDRLRLADLRLFGLDEYAGLIRQNPLSFGAFFRRHLLNPLDVATERLTMPRGSPSSWIEGCRAFEEAVSAAGGVRLQLLGIGSNGHIGFNEPGSSFGSRTRLVRLAASTRLDNELALHGKSEPTHAITQGIGTILEAEKLLLLVLGPEKAGILARALLGPVTTDVPASAIRLHPNSHVVVDAAAGALLS